MSDEYKLLAHLPFTDPEGDAVKRIADDLGVTVSLGPEGAPEVNTDTFLIYGFTRTRSTRRRCPTSSARRST